MSYFNKYKVAAFIFVIFLIIIIISFDLRTLGRTGDYVLKVDNLRSTRLLDHLRDAKYHYKLKQRGKTILRFKVVCGTDPLYYHPYSISKINKDTIAIYHRFWSQIVSIYVPINEGKVTLKKTKFSFADKSGDTSIISLKKTWDRLPGCYEDY